jgi:tellurite methyltransferase
MAQQDRDKWNDRYAAGAYADRLHPTAYLEASLPRLPRGRALDIACGAGRNAMFLAAAGYTVDAIDISGVALERGRAAATARGLSIHWIEADLEQDPLPSLRYDLIVCVRYVNRTLFAELGDALTREGYVVLEQHLQTPAEVVGPSHPAFRLAPGDLARCVAPLAIIDYREGIVTDPDGRPAALAQVVARHHAGDTPIG